MGPTPVAFSVDSRAEIIGADPARDPPRSACASCACLAHRAAREMSRLPIAWRAVVGARGRRAPTTPSLDMQPVWRHPMITRDVARIVDSVGGQAEGRRGSTHLLRGAAPSLCNTAAAHLLRWNRA